MGEQEVVFYSGSILTLQQFHSKEIGGGGGGSKNVLCMGIVKYQVGHMLRMSCACV